MVWIPAQPRPGTVWLASRVTGSASATVPVTLTGTGHATQYGAASAPAPVTLTGTGLTRGKGTAGCVCGVIITGHGTARRGPITQPPWASGGWEILLHATIRPMETDCPTHGIPYRINHAGDRECPWDGWTPPTPPPDSMSTW